ncbi:MAG: hypothetical protein Fur0028_13350 [Bacteroidales bacterium]
MKYIYLFTVLALLFSCNNENQAPTNSSQDSLNVTENLRPNHKEVLYYDGGQIKFVQEYFNGIKHGIYKNWYEDGSIRTLGAYYMGFRKGVWSWYGEKGQLEFQVNYDKQVASL